jgi:pantoate--beta-alanine ligase
LYPNYYKHLKKMITATTTVQLAAWLSEHRQDGSRLGFVPTMGALHQGHLSLISRCKEENDYTLCSVFVNPIQFNNPADLEKYPRMPEQDIRMLDEAGCDLVFIPAVEEVYPETPTRVYDFGNIDKVMEGAFRPGHFNGVAIVVSRFFSLILPDRAYFGLKDYQQYLIIRELVKMDGFKTEIIGCPIVRESDGLAMSSRNVRLTPEQRGNAPVIFQLLTSAKSHYSEFTPENLGKSIFDRLSIVPGCLPEYVTVSDADHLKPIYSWNQTEHAVICVAVHFGEVRLIDNMLLY